MLCQICQLDLTSWSVEIREKHVNQCIDSGDKATCDTAHTTQPVVVCQICQQDLSHLNSVRRTRHVNQCVDYVSNVFGFEILIWNNDS